VLLGFKPLHGAYTGINLSSVLLQTLNNHGIQDQVFGLTTDNALNNKILVDTLQQALSNDVNITWISCLAYII
jgi:hypothetical protein